MESSNKTVVISIVAILAIVGAGVGVFALTRDTSEDTSTTTSEVQNQSPETEDANPASSSEQANIVGLAQTTESLSTLVAAVQAADLVDTLNGSGPFTVFAPTNDAFAKLPAGTLDSLLLPENKATLSGILTYHVVSGKVMSTDLTNGQIIKTVNGANLTVEITGGTVMLVDAKGNKSTVATADVQASNGVVHIIDSVVLPQ
jgi:uncharacterized surface protein with fasciclin (FAS1) repeats